MKRHTARMGGLVKGVIGSIVLHIIILVCLRFVNVGVSFGEPEFVEVGLIAYTPLTESHVVVSKEALPEKELIELPEAKEGEEEEVTQEPSVKELPPISIPEKREEKETPSPVVIQGEPYIIEGELSKRRVTHKVIPSYPKGYNIETDVKVEIWVSPDGRVERLLLLKKGGHIFDQITLEALREWRFERLVLHLPQETQKGVVTFMYRLR
jgi:TonB family protein